MRFLNSDMRSRSTARRFSWVRRTGTQNWFPPCLLIPIHRGMRSQTAHFAIRARRMSSPGAQASGLDGGARIGSNTNQAVAFHLENPDAVSDDFMIARFEEMNALWGCGDRWWESPGSRGDAFNVRFGFSVALSGRGVAVIGAPGDKSRKQVSMTVLISAARIGPCRTTASAPLRYSREPEQCGTKPLT